MSVEIQVHERLTPDRAEWGRSSILPQLRPLSRGGEVTSHSAEPGIGAGDPDVGC